jgi:PAS domain S-box-containing protein
VSKTALLEAAFRVFGSFDDLVVTTDHCGRVTFWNAIAERIYGVPAADALGSSIAQLLGDTAPTVPPASAEPTENVECWMSNHLAPDGRRCWIDWRTVPIRVAAVNVDGFVHIGVDTTPQRETKQALSESETRFKLIVDHQTDVVVEFDPEGAFRFVSPSAAELFDIEPEVVMGRRPENVIHPDDWSLAKTSFDYLRRPPHTSSFELRVRRNDEWRWLGWSQRAVLDEDGNVISVVGAGRDITRRKKVEAELEAHRERLDHLVRQRTAQLQETNEALEQKICERQSVWEALRKSESLYQSTIEALEDGIHVLDRDLRITLFNRGFRKMCVRLSVDAERVIGRRLFDVFPFLPRAVADEYRRVFATGESVSTEEKTELSGVTVITETRKIPVFEDGKVIQVVTLLRDITNRKRRVEELQNAKAEAEQANRVKSDFLANMSHEIRTPLNGLVGMLRFLEATELSVEQSEYVRMALGSNEALLTVINDILDFSRMAAGEIEFEPRVFNLQEAIEETVHLFFPQAESKGVELVASYAGDTPRLVTADSARVRQIVANLVANAVKFTERGSVRVVIDCPKRDNGIAHVRVQVQDTGPGISPAERDRIFEQFKQLGQGGGLSGGGTGLGLTITRQLVTMMGGAIEVESEVGRGTRFTVVLPVPAEDEQCEEPGLLAGRRVLVACHGQHTRNALADELRRHGAEPAEVANAEESLAYLGRRPDAFSLVVIDHAPPAHDGFVLADQVAPLIDEKKTRVIVIASERERAAQAGVGGVAADVCLTKPVRQTRLARAVFDLFGVADATAERGELPGSEPAEAIPARVLLVEDDKINQLVAAKMLELIGCTVTIAENGAVALAKLAEQEFDLVFMDARMDVMDGYDATRRHRGLEPVDIHLPIIAMTAHAMKGAREKCLESGMDDYLSKPLDPKTLREMVVRWYHPTANRRPMANGRTSSKGKTVEP